MTDSTNWHVTRPHPLTCDFKELPPEDIEPMRPDPGDLIPRTDTHEQFMARHKQDEWLHWQLARTAKHLATPLMNPLHSRPKKNTAKKASKKK